MQYFEHLRKKSEQNCSWEKLELKSRDKIISEVINALITGCFDTVTEINRWDFVSAGSE
jgi:predicted Fe-S protein YdhL (DUF1289 family)